MFDFLDWMPEQASTFAAEVDWINNFISITSFISLVLITGVMLIFAFKYRKKSDNQETKYFTHDVQLETVWTVVPTIICIYCFYIGYVSYDDMRNPPANAIEINVEGFKWKWAFEYPTGKKTIGDLTVPVGQPVRLIMKSRDVNHSFFIPSMRVKEDVIASQYNYLWFQPIKTGEYPIFCTEYCGTEHSGMLGKLNVVEPEVYEDYIHDRAKSTPDLPPAEWGALLFTEKGCNACHSVNGTRLIGPSLLEISGRKGKTTTGESYVADDEYIKESILYPNKQVVEGYPAAMTAFDGLVSDEELNALIEYLKTLKEG